MPQALKPDGPDEVGRFWVVTYPRRSSELGDVCFETDVWGLVNQIRGGLAPEMVVGIYRARETAEAAAEALLEAIKKV